jgi:hypothetical protein
VFRDLPAKKIGVSAAGIAIVFAVICFGSLVSLLQTFSVCRADLTKWEKAYRECQRVLPFVGYMLAPRQDPISVL